MIYDRYGKFTFQEADEPRMVAASQSAEPCPEPVSREDVHAVPGPVPHTHYKSKGDARLLDPVQDELVLIPDALRYYDKLYEERRRLAEHVQTEEGECEFVLGQSLRVTWVPQQRADKALAQLFRAQPLPHGYRMAPDGLLEREVPLPPPTHSAWVPIVPEGNALGHLSWKRLLFLQFHVGILGAHRSAAKTFLLMSRQVWWSKMKEDLHQFVEKCLTCIRFRKMPSKQEQVFVIPTDRDCWEEVMVDLGSQ